MFLDICHKIFKNDNPLVLHQASLWTIVTDIYYMKYSAL